MDDPTTDRILAAAIEVRRVLGPGLLESAYEVFLCHELGLRGATVIRQVALPVVYKGVRLEIGYRIDLLVDDSVIVEIKTVEKLLPQHAAQLLTYLRLSDKRVGLLLNFNAVPLKGGIQRVVNNF